MTWELRPSPTSHSALSTHFWVASGTMELSLKMYRDGFETYRATCSGTARFGSPIPSSPSVHGQSPT